MRTWRISEVENVIRAVEDIGISSRNRSKYYIDKYGVVPKFRAGVHGGEIVSGSVGSERKMEIVYFGDTINTVARLTALSRELGVEVLVSEDLTNWNPHTEFYTVADPAPASELGDDYDNVLLAPRTESPDHLYYKLNIYTK